MGGNTETPEAAAKEGKQGREINIACAKRKVIQAPSPVGQSM